MAATEHGHGAETDAPTAYALSMTGEGVPRYVGPFSTREEADAWASLRVALSGTDGTWDVLYLHDPYPNPEPDPEHRLSGTGCVCGWKARLGESITRGYDLHLLDRRCDWCGGPIPTTKRVDAETCSQRCAVDRQRARVIPPATSGGSDG